MFSPKKPKINLKRANLFFEDMIDRAHSEFKSVVEKLANKLDLDTDVLYVNELKLSVGENNKFILTLFTPPPREVVRRRRRGGGDEKVEDKVEDESIGKFSKSPPLNLKFELSFSDIKSLLGEMEAISKGKEFIRSRIFLHSKDGKELDHHKEFSFDIKMDKAALNWKLDYYFHAIEGPDYRKKSTISEVKEINVNFSGDAAKEKEEIDQAEKAIAAWLQMELNLKDLKVDEFKIHKHEHRFKEYEYNSHSFKMTIPRSEIEKQLSLNCFDLFTERDEKDSDLRDREEPDSPRSP